MNTIDIVSLVLILILLLIGLWHGLLRGIFRLIAWIAAIAGAYLAYKFLSDLFVAIGFSDFTAAIVSMCIGFLVPFLGLLYAGHRTNKAIAKTVVGKVDRILGAFFGLVKAYLILFVILTILHIIPFTGSFKETRDSAVAYSIYKSSLEILGFSSEPVDIVGAAERKATEIVNKASEKATEAAKDAADKATEAAKDAAETAVKNATKEVTDKVSKEINEKATYAKQKVAE